MKKTLELIGLFFIASIVLFLIGRYFFSNLSTDASYHSPNHRFIATVSYATYGGAAGGVQTYVQIQDTQTKHIRLLYTAKALQNVQIQWENEQLLTITNGPHSARLTQTLDVIHDESFEKTPLLCKYLCKRPAS